MPNPDSLTPDSLVFRMAEVSLKPEFIQEADVRMLFNNNLASPLERRMDVKVLMSEFV